MTEMTLREVCLSIGVTRRAIQGYEQAKLVSATRRTPSGYLLYDDFARTRIKEIKLYQDMGFSLKEIQQIIDAPAEVKKPALIHRKNMLHDDIEHFNKMITFIEQMIDKL